MPVTRTSLIMRVTEGGDPVSWEEFFSIYRPFVYGVARRWGIKDHDACDVVQDVFVTLLGALPRFEYSTKRGRFRGWLKTIVHNLAIDRHRRRRRSREVAWDWDHKAEVFPTEGDECDAAHRRQVLESALQQVRSASTPATWRCFEERFLRQRSAAEVSAETGLTPAAVHMNVSRTRARIRAKYVEIDSQPAKDPSVAPTSERSTMGREYMPRRRRS